MLVNEREKKKKQDKIIRIITFYTLLILAFWNTCLVAYYKYYEVSKSYGRTRNEMVALRTKQKR